MKKTCLAILLILSFLSVTFAKPKYIGMQRAKQIALKQVKGRIKSSELEREHGKMIYSFDIRTANRGITEVNIDAVTGAVIAVTAETAAGEAKEKADDKKSGKP
ncbi:MAG: PepSY domain-containing protein [Acidobacteriota bacterium]